MNNPINIAAASVDVEMRVRLVDGSVVVRKQSGGPTQYAHLTDGLDGWGRFFWGTTATTAWPLGMVFVQMILKDSGTTPATDDVWAQGFLKVNPLSTQDPAP